MRWCVSCNSVTGEDRWPVSAPLAEGAQPGAGKRAMDKRRGSEGKRSREFPVLYRKGMIKLVNDREAVKSSLVSVTEHNTHTNTTTCNVFFTLTLPTPCTCAGLLPAQSLLASASFFYPPLRSKCSTMSSLIKHGLSTSLLWSPVLLSTEESLCFFPAPRWTMWSINGLWFFKYLKNGVSLLRHLGILTETWTTPLQPGLPTMT